MKLKLSPLAVGAAAIPCAALAGRPLVVDDAFTVRPGNCELEAGYFLHNAAGLHHQELPFGITTGVSRTLELSLGFPSHVEEEQNLSGDLTTRAGIGDLVLGMKWNPVSGTNHWASHAFALGVKFPTADKNHELGSGKMDFDVMYIASRNLSDRLSAHFNAGYRFVGNDSGQRHDDVVHCGAAMGWFVAEPVELVAEVYNDLLPRQSGDATSIRTGVRWVVYDALILDAAIGAGLGGSAPDFHVTAGLTWCFGFMPKK